MGRRFTRPTAGEWVQPKRRGYKLACCDCGLVHRMDFRVHRGRPQFRAFRDGRSTGAMRRNETVRRKRMGISTADIERRFAQERRWERVLARFDE